MPRPTLRGAHLGALRLWGGGRGSALGGALLHSAAMVASGIAVAWIVYRHVGLRCLNRAWLDLRVLWALCLIVSGAACVVMARSA